MTECIVYRSAKREETYLYLEASRSLDELPEELAASFGHAVEVMRLDLKPNTHLAIAHTPTVLGALEDPGYFLQLPPAVPVEELISRRFA